ncbi:MAG: shikimate dehydrogenase [Kiritimatiellia bacterium]
MKPIDFEISASTRVFAVLGQPVSHSLSPAMHNPTLRAMGLNAVYLAFETAPEELMQTLQVFARRGFAGVNLTIPLKEVAFEGISSRSPEAQLSGSVNTVVFRPDGSLEGHSTDGYGLSQALRESFGCRFSGRHVCIFGCGGAGRAAALQAASEGAATLTLANRTRQKAENLAAELGREFPGLHLEVAPVWPPQPEATLPADILLQSTSLGMKTEAEAWISSKNFRSGQVLMDMTYVQKQTPVMQCAAEAGAEVANGLGMLLHQGVRSLEIWTGQSVPVEVMRDALQRRVYGEGGG